jgi:Tol biopolymer transport system component
VLLGIVAVVALGTGGATAWWLGDGWDAKPPAALPIRFTTTLGMPGVDDPRIAISADGRRVAQGVADSAGITRLMVRDLSANTLAAIPGTEGAYGPDFSPDGNSLAFAIDGRLLKISLQGGPPTVLVDSMTVDGGSAWTDTGDIIFCGRNTGLWRVPVAGGTPVQLTRVDEARKEFAHWFPQLLPGGRALIYSSYATPVARSRIESYEFESGRTTVLVEGALIGRYSPSGHLLFVRDGALFAIAFDPQRLATHGPAVPVQDDLDWAPTDGTAAYDVSDTGTLVFLRESEGSFDRTLVWRDRAGADVPVIEQAGAWTEPRLSPDGRWIVLSNLRPKEDLWLYETGRRSLTQLTRAEGAAFNAVWMPDSRHIVYSHEDPVYNLRTMPIDGSAADRLVLASQFDKYASSVSPDGLSMLLTEYSDAFRVLVADLAGSAPPRPLLESGRSRLGTFSPDGRWIAYSEHSGSRAEIYIRPVDGTSGRRLVSTSGGMQPRWTKDGREIVYLSGTSLMSVSIDPDTGEPGVPAALFSLTDLAIDAQGRRHSYDVTANGERFLVVKRVERLHAQPLAVVVNWRPEPAQARL